MELREVVSSNIKRVGYEDKAKVLYVEYNSGLYAYGPVEKPLYEELLKAESVGKFISANIKGKYSFLKLQ